MNDDQQNLYVLGLREMFNKSAITMIDTLRDTLRNINSISIDEPNNNDNVGNQILSKIKCTMSDRAATENHLLEEFRREILPEVTQN